jgi:hypothetical protein
LPSSDNRSISGSVFVDADRAPFDRAVLHLYLEDVGRQDAAAVRLAEAHLEIGPHRRGSDTRLPFTLDAPPAPAGSSLALRCHLATHDGTDVRVGDKVSTTHVPVAASGDVTGLRIGLRDVD